MEISHSHVNENESGFDIPIIGKHSRRSHHIPGSGGRPIRRKMSFDGRINKISTQKQACLVCALCVCGTPLRQLQRLSRHYLVSQMSKPIKNQNGTPKSDTGCACALLCFAIYARFPCRRWVFVFPTYVDVVDASGLPLLFFKQKKKMEFI